MDQRTAYPRRLLRLCAVAAALLLSAGCGGGKAVVAPVSELSEGARSRPPVVRATTEHRVQPGETLYSIAFLYGLDFQQVARWNGIRAPYLIRVGQWLRLTPPGRTAEAPPTKPAPPAPAAKPTPSKPPARGDAAARPAPAPKAVRAAPAPKPKPKPAQPSGPLKLSWRWPTEGKLLSTFSSKRPGGKGIDIGGKRGQPVVAAAGGEVVYSGSGLQRYYGKLIIIKHNDRYLSAYAHNERLLVKEGSRVDTGQRIATLGSSGTDRVKLHFEIRRDGKPVNPIRYLPKR